MSTLLELVKELADESGTVSSDQITTIEGTISDSHVRDLVRWIRKSNLEIERMRDDWRFRIREGTIDLEADVTDYDLAAYLPDFKKVVPYHYPYHRPHILVNDQYRSVDFIDYPRWAGHYDLRLTHTQPGQTRAFTVLPDQTIRVYPKPDQAHKLTFNYIRQPSMIAVKDDCEPNIPEDMQNVIVYHALRKYVFYDEADRRMQTVQLELDQALRDLYNDQLFDIRVDNPTFRGDY